MDARFGVTHDELRRKQLRNDFGQDAVVFKRRRSVKSPEHKSTFGTHQSRQLRHIARLCGGVQTVKTTDVECEIKRSDQIIEPADITYPKVDIDSNVVSFLTSQGNGLR